MIHYASNSSRQGASSGHDRLLVRQQVGLAYRLVGQVAKNLSVSAGYNVLGLTDRDLSSDYTSKGAYIQLRFYARYSALHPAAPLLGQPTAPVTLVEMFDYNCSFCRIAQPRIAALLKSSPDLRVVMVMTPILGADSTVLARFALAADLQGRFAQVHDSLFTGPTPQPTDEASLSLLARANGVNWPRAKTDMAGAAVTARLATMTQDWEALGRVGTPSFLTPKGRIVGAVSIEVLAASLNAGEGAK
ncbi:putative DsbA family dithiol-disulfide isomerase [Variovorax sp. GrIS 2.14]|uniref:DsbA family protein n=1 Tax=Variovorax sp. GrIS 2.14 TaxID=3071709 RepID=UPI0038F75CA9